MIILVAVFAVPYALSWLLYTHPGLLNLGSRSHGTLLSPVIGPGEYQLLKLNGQAYVADPAADKWTLMSFGSSACDPDCVKNLFTMQQLRKMMAVDKARVRRAYIILDLQTPEAIESELAQYAGTELYSVDATQAASLEQKLGIAAGQLGQHVLVADPGGNLVMLYRRDMDPKKIFADLEILFGRVKKI